MLRKLLAILPYLAGALEQAQARPFIKYTILFVLLAVFGCCLLEYMRPDIFGTGLIEIISQLMAEIEF